jgi:hypothetical protein
VRWDYKFGLEGIDDSEAELYGFDDDETFAVMADYIKKIRSFIKNRKKVCNEQTENLNLDIMLSKLDRKIYFT